MLSAGEKEFLRARARAAAEAAIRGTPAPDAPPPPEWTALHAEGGVFVTLKTDGALRGCLGCFRHAPPLYRTVGEYAALSATADPRFAGRRLRPEELPGLGVEVSVLSPLAPCADPASVRLGVDGIYVTDTATGRSGCFLPQVATETGWGAEEFWGRCCRDKAGLDYDAWRDPGAAVRRFTFTAEVF